MKYILLLTPILFFAGCLQTREDTKAVEEKQVLQSQLKTIQRTNADSANRFEEIEAENRRLNGRIDAQEVRQNQLMARIDKADADRGARTHESDQKVEVLKDDLAKLEQSIQELANRIAALEESQKRAPAPVKGAEAAKAALKEADDLFGKKQWKEAILEYEKYRKAAPKGRSVPLATYRIGVCFQELGLQDEARAFYDDVTAKFPGTPEAEKSAARLKKLKKR